jgi:hypothetical protein
VEEDVIEYAAEGVVGVGAAGASSTASEMARPRLPGESGSRASIFLPAAVLSDGLGMTSAP